MIKKSLVRLTILGMLLFGAAQAAYGYWTDQIAVREEMAVLWPVEIEIETQEESEPETGQENLQEEMEQDV